LLKPEQAKRKSHRSMNRPTISKRQTWRLCYHSAASFVTEHLFLLADYASTNRTFPGKQNHLEFLRKYNDKTIE
jgi:hypothetical protein